MQLPWVNRREAEMARGTAYAEGFQAGYVMGRLLAASEEPAAKEGSP